MVLENNRMDTKHSAAEDIGSYGSEDESTCSQSSDRSGATRPSVKITSGAGNPSRRRARRSMAALHNRLSTIVEMSKERWSQFSLFGVDDTSAVPHVWGNRVRSSTMSDFGMAWDCDCVSTMPAVSKLSRQSSFHDEMRVQLRDERVQMTYYDIFDTDIQLASGTRLIRVFSLGATCLEYFKIVLAVWTFFVSTIVVFFWKVLGPLDNQLPLLTADFGIDVVFAICLVVQLRTTILAVRTGREICNTRKILHKHLVDVTFWFDAISCLPLILLDQVIGVRWIALVKACRGWRICRIPPEKQFVPSNTFTVLQLAGLILMGGHLLACLWFVIAYEKEKTMHNYVPANLNSVNSWHADRYQYCLGENPPGCFLEFYSVALLNGVYLLMGIDRDAHSAFEHLFVTFCAPIGLLVHAYMLGEIVLLIQRRGALDTKQNENTLAIQEAMRILRLPANLQMRIIAFFTYERIHRSGRLFDALFAHLSPQLRFELHLHLYLGLVRQCKLFRATQPRALREIVCHLVDVIYLPGDWICRYGDYGDSMYFIVTGSCAVIDHDTITELHVLERGQYFGEVALLTGVPRTAYVRANRFCVMAQLTKEAFAPIVQKWPEEIDVLITDVSRHSDRIKIKAEASKRYGLKKTASSASLDANFVGALPGSPLQAQPRGSRMSVNSAEPATVEEEEDAPRCQADKNKPPELGQEGGRPSGPTTLKELLQSQASQLSSRKTSCHENDRTSLALRTWSGPNAACTPHSAASTAGSGSNTSFDEVFGKNTSATDLSLLPMLLGSALSHASSGSSELKCEPPVQNQVSRREFSTEEGRSRTLASCGAALQAPDHPGCSLGVDSCPPIGRVTPHVPPHVSGSATLTMGELTRASWGAPDVGGSPIARDQRDELRHVQQQLSSVAEHVALLQEEVMKQRSMFTESLGDMKQCAVDAVKEAVAQELANLKCGTRRSSMHSASDSGMGSTNFAQIGLSTPFT